MVSGSIFAVHNEHVRIELSGGNLTVGRLSFAQKVGAQLQHRNYGTA
jgi:hypothetical protein